MNRWNWVLLALVFVMVFPNIYYLLQAWSAERHYRTIIHKIDPSMNGPLPADAKDLGELHNLRQSNKEIFFGKDTSRNLAEKQIDELGITELQAKLQTILAERKQAWFNCAIAENPSTDNPVNPDIDPGGEQKPLQLVSVTLRSPPAEEGETPQLFDVNGTVYLFAEKEETPLVYLGAYSVTNPVKDSPTLALLSTEAFTEEEVEKVRAARSQGKSISVYSILPTGRDLSYYEPIGVPASGDTEGEEESEPGDISPGESRRDFEILFAAAYRRRHDLEREINKHQENVRTLEISQKKAEDEQKALEEEKTLYEKRIAAMKVQRDAADQKSKEIDSLIKLLNRKIEEAQFNNEEFVAKIAEQQRSVKDIIDQSADRAASNANAPK